MDFLEWLADELAVTEDSDDAKKIEIGFDEDTSLDTITEN